MSPEIVNIGISSSTLTLLLIILISLCCTSCESRFVELTQSNYEIEENSSLKERIQKKKKEDESLEQIYSSSQKMKESLWIVKNAVYKNNSKPTDSLTTNSSAEYFPIEFINNFIHVLLDKIPESVKNQTPSEVNGPHIRRGQMKLPKASFNFLSEECLTLDTLLKFENADFNNKDAESNGAEIIFYLKTCHLFPEYTPFLNIKINVNGFKVQVLNNIIEVLSQQKQFSLEKLHCEIILDKEVNSIESIECQNLQIQFTNDQILSFENLKYSQRHEIKVFGNFDIYENQEKKYSKIVRIYSNRSSIVENRSAGDSK